MLLRLALRNPDVILGGARPYLRRWYIIRLSKRGLGNVYLHHILRSDDDRALHDHPWWNVSIVLRGGYWEWMPAWVETDLPGILARAESDLRVWRGPGSIVFRRATAAHRLELPFGKTAWTLFITGKNVRSWGFHCTQGWKHWRAFIGLPAGEPNGAEIGPGCGE